MIQKQKDVFVGAIEEEMNELVTLGLLLEVKKLQEENTRLRIDNLAKDMKLKRHDEEITELLVSLGSLNKK